MIFYISLFPSAFTWSKGSSISPRPSDSESWRSPISHSNRTSSIPTRSAISLRQPSHLRSQHAFRKHTVVNLSQRTLTPIETSVLSLGMNFALTPKSSQLSQPCDDSTNQRLMMSDYRWVMFYVKPSQPSPTSLRESFLLYGTSDETAPSTSSPQTKATLQSSWTNPNKISTAKPVPNPESKVSDLTLSACLPYLSSTSHKLQRILWQAGIDVFHSAPSKLQGLLHTHKDKPDPNNRAGVYRIPCECGKVYIGETKCNLPTRLKEHHRQARALPTKHTS